VSHNFTDLTPINIRYWTPDSKRFFGNFDYSTTIPQAHRKVGTRGGRSSFPTGWLSRLGPSGDILTFESTGDCAMPRKTLPVHLRTHGPGTGGRNVERDKQICALKATGLSNEEVGKHFGLSRERVRNVLDTAERDAKAGRTRWMSAPERRAEFWKQRTGE
jgi:hypothetical protein